MRGRVIGFDVMSCKAMGKKLGACETALILITRPLTRSLAALGIDLSPQSAGRGEGA
ncbi:hypothetical protein SAMN05519103_08126 [Rhizobiales bacterium GAS113]|nr:hypothetical protein SAMN05519103_08126 [Rhizobiales bacterium GAS113]